MAGTSLTEEEVFQIKEFLLEVETIPLTINRLLKWGLNRKEANKIFNVVIISVGEWEREKII